MRRNEIFTASTIANEDDSLISMVQENISEEKSKADTSLSIPAECLYDFRKAMKIGYYKELHKQKLITDNQLEQLIQLQDKQPIKEAA